LGLPVSVIKMKSFRAKPFCVSPFSVQIFILRLSVENFDENPRVLRSTEVVHRKRCGSLRAPLRRDSKGASTNELSALRNVDEPLQVTFDRIHHKISLRNSPATIDD
jgi:hypothetical protein